MIYLKYINDRGEEVKPLLHAGIVESYYENDEFLIISLQKTLPVGEKQTIYKWGLTVLKSKIQNYNEVIAFLKTVNYDSDFETRAQLKNKKPKSNKNQKVKEPPIVVTQNALKFE